MMLHIVLEPSIKIADVEVYITANYWIDKIDGMEALSRGNSRKYEFEPEMFKRIS